MKNIYSWVGESVSYPVRNTVILYGCLRPVAGALQVSAAAVGWQDGPGPGGRSEVPGGGCTPADGTPRIYCYSKLPLGEQSCRRCPIIWAVDFNSHCVLKAQQNNSGKKKKSPLHLDGPFPPSPASLFVQ